MSDHSVFAPLLPSDHLHHSSNGEAPEQHVILTVDDDGVHHQLSNGDAPITEVVDDNPYAFLGANRFDMPGSTTIDPFRNNTPTIQGVYEWLKIVVCLPIALARLVLFGLSMMLGYVSTKLALLGWKDRSNPMPKWRSRLMGVTRFATRTILFSFGYQWIRRKGKPAPREIAPIVVSNHVSYIDPIFFFYELFPTIVASESHDSMPFVGTIIRAMQVIYVNRFSPTSRKHAVDEIKFHNFMEIEYLPVITPHENRKESAARFAQRTGHAVASALNVVQTSHSYGDVLLLSKALEANQENPSLYLVEMAGLEAAFHLSSLEAVDFLDVFLSMNPDSRGQVEIHDFLKVLRLKPCTLSEKIFGFIDVQKYGKITFKQFLVGSAHILKQPLFHQASESAFVACDGDRKNYILEQEFGDSLILSVPGLSNNEIHGLFTLFDTDCDGKISKDDFIGCLRRYPLLIALFSSCVLQQICP